MLRSHPLLRLLVINASGGALIGLLFALSLVALDAAQLWTLISRDRRARSRSCCCWQASRSRSVVFRPRRP